MPAIFKRGKTIINANTAVKDLTGYGWHAIFQCVQPPESQSVHTQFFGKQIEGAFLCYR